jgi:hypothetical protein
LWNVAGGAGGVDLEGDDEVAGGGAGADGFDVEGDRAADVQTNTRGGMLPRRDVGIGPPHLVAVPAPHARHSRGQKVRVVQRRGHRGRVGRRIADAQLGVAVVETDVGGNRQRERHEARLRVRVVCRSRRVAIVPVGVPGDAVAVPVGVVDQDDLPRPRVVAGDVFDGFFGLAAVRAAGDASELLSLSTSASMPSLSAINRNTSCRSVDAFEMA